jgi:hypothetical protein
MNIYIPNIEFNSIDKRHLFIATRPFYLESSWGNDTDQKESWGISDNYTEDINNAQALLIPKPVNSYSNKELSQLNSYCEEHNILGYGFISGDSGTVFKYFEYLSYFRVGGFKKQLPKNNIGLPVSLSDIYQSLYRDKKNDFRDKHQIPIVGFCGHASRSLKKLAKDKLSFVQKNVFRFFKNPFRKDYEPLFASAHERFKLLKTLENSSIIRTNFIYRKNYRAGAITKKMRKQTNRDYYENIRESDYVLCIRGAGNFSVRLYETLMMGRIPIFIDTDCLLPFSEVIDWEKRMVWVPWEKRNDLEKLVVDFHNSLSPEEFKQLQDSIRQLWINSLSVVGIMDHIRKNTITT